MNLHFGTAVIRKMINEKKQCDGPPVYYPRLPFFSILLVTPPAIETFHNYRFTPATRCLAESFGFPGVICRSKSQTWWLVPN